MDSGSLGKIDSKSASGLPHFLEKEEKPCDTGAEKSTSHLDRINASLTMILIIRPAPASQHPAPGPQCPPIHLKLINKEPRDDVR